MPHANAFVSPLLTNIRKCGMFRMKAKRELISAPHSTFRKDSGGVIFFWGVSHAC